MGRYITPSSDMFVYVADYETEMEQSALAGSPINFCSHCGVVVYRTDLHDAFHDRINSIALGMGPLI